MVEVLELKSFMAAIDSKPMTSSYCKVHNFNYSLSAVIGDKLIC